MFAVALAAGFIDAICGGGGLLSVPALMMIGLSPAQALATNKLQGVFGKLSSARYFLKKRIIKIRKMKWALLYCFIFSMLGAFAVQIINPIVLQTFIPWAIVAVTLYILFSPRLSDLDHRKRIRRTVYGIAVVPIVAFYDGFFGPASGSFLVVSFVALLGYNTTKALGYSKLLLVVANFGALIAFAIGGHVLWGLGLIMAVGQYIGAHLGSRLVYRKGNKLVKPMLAGVSMAFFAKILYDAYLLNAF